MKMYKNYIPFLTIKDIYAGIKRGILPPDSAVKYAECYAAVCPDTDSEIIIKLLIADSDEEVAALLGRRFGKTSARPEKSIEKLLFVTLNELSNQFDGDELLDAIESVYADFDYPPELNEFISYMPADNSDYAPSAHTHDENVRHIVDSFNAYLTHKAKTLGYQPPGEN